MTEVILNSEQQQFYNKITELDFTKLLLTGEAGCGKTFVLTQALAKLQREGKKVILCAPTHMARIQLLEKMPEDIRHEVPTSTTASLLSRYPILGSDGNTFFSKATMENINKWDIIAIDEVSMLSKNEVDVLQHSSAKIIYSGDFAQLPTVMQKRADFRNVPNFHLVQQMRQSGPILQAAQENRDEVKFPTQSVYSDDGNVIVNDHIDSLLSIFYTNLLSCKNIKETTDHRYITFTNKEALEVSSNARDKIHGIESDEKPFINGEYILLYESCAAGYNGEVVKVTGVKKTPSDPRAFRYSHLFKSYEVEVEGSRGKCWIGVIPPKCNPVVEEYKEQIIERIKLARKTRNEGELNVCFDELKVFDQLWTKVGYPYAITCHKSQGQSIPNVYVNTTAFQKASNKRALLYVALSRAVENLYTVKVEDPRWLVVRKINEEYKEAKNLYQSTFNSCPHKFRWKLGLKARTPEQKEITTGVIMAAIDKAAKGENVLQF